ncbi:hypothetical protein HEP74_00150 [Xanthomonas sp. SS]|uniref:hypothetical protein n=1 Tax=Xanthomonas sp. SS TaxID=2724122 RepID=UPI00163A7F9B|nr:hypothetical protein [Xanthomonas sp. SS]QNH15037.1 hypothetical protein HEP74_00150 [Xanthomonas sp. SS]
MEPIKRYLIAPPSGHAILLNGPWGSGKSYQWEQFSQTLEEIGREPITLSVAGLKSQEQLESALLQASLSGLGNEAMREAVTVIGRALLRAVKIEPDDIKLKSDFSSGKTVVCLDDVERFAGDFPVLFGFIINLLDRARIHCVLLADEKRAVEKFGKDFRVSKERIIGRTVAVTPNFVSFSAEVVRGLADQVTRDLLMRHIDYIEILLSLCGASNLRTVRYFIIEAASMITEIRPVEQSDIRPLLSAVCFWTFSASRDAAELEVAANVFRIGGMDVAIQMNMNRNNASDAADDIVTRAALLLQDSGLEGEGATWPKSPAFAALIGGGEADVAMIAEDFALHAVESSSQARALQATLNGYSQMSDVELQSAIVEARALIQRGMDGDLVELFELYRTLRHFRELGFIAETEEDFDRQMHAAFSNYDASRITCDEAGLDFLLEHQGASGLPVWDVIRTLADRIEAQSVDDRKRELLAQLADPSKEVPGLIESEGMFTGLDPNAYAIELIAGAPMTTDRLSKAIRKAYRVSNVKSYLQSEAPFYDALALALEAELKLDTPRTIAQVSVLAIVDQLTALADRVR